MRAHRAGLALALAVLAAFCLSAQDKPDALRLYVDGKYDDLPEQAFFMVGGIDEGIAQAKTLGGHAGAEQVADVPQTDDHPQTPAGEAAPQAAG